MKKALYIIACLLFGAIIGCVLVIIIQKAEQRENYVQYQDGQPQYDHSKVYFYKRF